MSNDETPTYSMKQVCDETGLSYETLKFYCNQGLVPEVGRNEYNHRRFTAGHIEWIKSLHCLRDCGLTLAEMKRYTELCGQGEKSIPERQEILARKLEELKIQQHQLQANIDYIHKKQAYYRDVVAGVRPYKSYVFTQKPKSNRKDKHE